jgi:hypothetical protein
VSAAIEKRPLVGLGDLLRAAITLNASPSDCRRIAALLDVAGTAPPLPPPSRRVRVTAPPPAPRPQTPASDPAALPAKAPQALARDLAQRFEAASGGAFTLLEPETVEPPEWAVPDGVPPASPALEGARPAPLHEPLFVPTQTRNILAAVLAVEEANGPIDAARLVEEVASCRAITRLPRARSVTLRRGAVVLLDRGDSMEPFQRDVIEVIAAIERLIGRDGLIRATFEGTPSKLSRWADGEPWTFSAPPGTPVLLVTDLGLRRPWEEREWVSFVEVTQRASCPVIAIAPYPSDRWPELLAQHLRAVVWDRTTTVGQASREARRSGARS